MGFLERAIRNGIRKGIGDAVGKAVQQAVEPKATELVNQAAEKLDQQRGQRKQPAGGLESALGNLERSMQGYATEAAKNTKICPNCGKPRSADIKFCPGCGAKLPEETLAAGALCPSCGKQNTIGTKFCCDCGKKLPAAMAEEQAQSDRNAAVMAEWDEKLAAYPKWNLGGTELDIEMIDGGYIIFSVCFPGDPNAAYAAMKQYREILQQYGFKQAGQYPSIEHLYKKVNSVCYHVDTEHCFDGDSDRACFGMDHYEPVGGFDYVKPEPKKKGFFDLFK